MNPLLTDPVVLITSGIILVGLVCLFWAAGAWRRLAKTPARPSPSGDILSSLPESRGFEMGALPVRAAPAGMPVISKDVADRLDNMTQRLAEMQSVLLKSSPAAGAEAGAPAGGVGQGFSPETIDKLLKIIGNVVQQVDILQKSLNPAKDGAARADPGAPPLAKV
jgi:hypothetical protein